MAFADVLFAMTIEPSDETEIERASPRNTVKTRCAKLFPDMSL